ncbi:MAG: hypothetical protein ACO3LE_02650 [Bdellovibrionota bacterium]
MFRWGVISFLFLVVFTFSQSFSSLMLQELAKDKLKSDALIWIDKIKRHQSPKWLMAEEKLKVFKFCSGFLDEDFGFQGRTPKVILFIESDLENFDILSSKIYDQRKNGHDLQVTSLAAKDINFEWMKNEAFLAEHGKTTDLIEADYMHGTRRFDRLLDEAAELCTSSMFDENQKYLEMEEIRKALESRPLAFVAYEYSAVSDQAFLEIIFESQNLIFKNKIHRDFQIY